ncbi:MAG: hypothetical protein ACKOXF_00750 [Chitinophagaceae bacterium]
MKKPLIQALRDSFSLEICGIEHNRSSLERTPLYTTYQWQTNEFSVEELLFLLDYFRDILLEQNYVLQYSKDHQIILDKGIKNTHYVHALKPDLSFKESITPEHYYFFGNIQLEVHVAETVNSLQISCQYFSHKTYLSFEKMMEVLLA